MKTNPTTCKQLAFDFASYQNRTPVKALVEPKPKPWTLDLEAYQQAKQNQPAKNGRMKVDPSIVLEDVCRHQAEYVRAVNNVKAISAYRKLSNQVEDIRQEILNLMVTDKINAGDYPKPGKSVPESVFPITHVPQPNKWYLGFSEEQRHAIIQEFLHTKATKTTIWHKYTGQTKEKGQLTRWMRQLGYAPKPRRKSKK